MLESIWAKAGNPPEWVIAGPNVSIWVQYLAQWYLGGALALAHNTRTLSKSCPHWGLNLYCGLPSPVQADPPPTLCLVSILLLLLLPFILFYNQLFTLYKVNFLTNLTLPCWRSLGCEKMTIKSPTNLHLSKVSWFLQFHTGAVSFHSNNTRKTANIATFQTAARLLNNDWLWKLRMNVGTTLYRIALWDGVWKCLWGRAGEEVQSRI